MEHTRVARLKDIVDFKKEIDNAGRILQSGGLVAFPTETVYGLGANGFDARACHAIYEAKGRPSDNPLILHVADRSMVDAVAADVPLMAEQLMAAFCPGPLTLILPRGSRVPDAVTGGLDTVGIRMPDHDIARAMIRSAGCPVAAPSANLSGRPSPTTAEAVLQDMDGRIPLILDGGPCSYGVESTIVDCTGSTAAILRPGAITREMLEELLGDVDLDPALAGESSIPRAPGMKYRHYAPKAPLTLLEGPADLMAQGMQEELKKRANQRVGVIASEEAAAYLRAFLPAERIVSYGKQGDLQSIAANLYESLRAFDDMPMDSLLAEGTQETGLGLAIMNRLHKASGFRSIVLSDKLRKG